MPKITIKQHRTLLRNPRRGTTARVDIWAWLSTLAMAQDGSVFGGAFSSHHFR